MKKITTLLAAVVLSQLASAQISVTGTSLTYAQNFDALDTSSAITTSSIAPLAGWAIFEVGSSTSTVNNEYRGGTGALNTGDTYSFGSAGVAERALGSIASGSNVPSYGVSFVNNTGATISGFTMKYRVEEWRFGQFRNGIGSPDTTRFLYSTVANTVADTGAANGWIEDVAGMLNTPNLTDTVVGAKNGNATGYFTNKTVTETVSIPNGGHIVLRWQDVNIGGSDDGLAIDSFSITFATTGVVSPKPTIVSLSPAAGATGVLAGANLAITFNKPVTAGTGNIVIKNQTTQTSVTKSVTSADVTVSGAVVTVANTGLALGNTYHVTFDSTAFDSSIYNSYGIYDTTAWKFTTASGVVNLDSLNENFNSSCPAGLPAGWVSYSVTGPQVWGCTAYGYGGTYGMQMNGYAAHINNANNDWLISPKLDLSSFTNVFLQFQAKKEFKGDDLTVMVSNNYSGAGDPTSATWTNLNINFAPASIDTQFHAYTANLTTYKSQPIFVGIQYMSRPNATDTNAARWTVDNVQTLRSVGLSVVSNEKLQLTVVGASTTSNVNLLFTAADNANCNLEIFDITGRRVYTENRYIAAGTQRIALTDLNLHAGMYIVKLSNDHSYGVVKTTVQ